LKTLKKQIIKDLTRGVNNKRGRRGLLDKNKTNKIIDGRNKGKGDKK
jgi:hypothetical protein